MINSRLLWIITLLLMVGTLMVGAEEWAKFSSIVGKDADFIFQYQELMRGQKVIGRRLVKVYWERKGYQRSVLVPEWKEWTYRDFRKSTDTLTTKFSFYGRGQHLVTMAPHRGMIQYPGRTARLGISEPEICCSVTEFDDFLQEIGSIKRAEKNIKDHLKATVFGDNRPLR